KLDEAALQKVFLKSLENYINWCNYLCITPVWSSLEAVSKEKKLLYVSLYLLIWGEASNVRFLPECLCYIFHHFSCINLIDNIGLNLLSGGPNANKQ
ncbi:callose synthase 9-like, partial [Trifolium medium]|nr:callose synthase 9-like [Trifolium medium]